MVLSLQGSHAVYFRYEFVCVFLNIFRMSMPWYYVKH